MTFSEALDCMNAGYKIARTGWNGKNMYIFIQEKFLLEGTAFEPCICMKTAEGKIQPGWLASQADLLAIDWETVGYRG